jgi:hypothetical protein
MDVPPEVLIILEEWLKHQEFLKNLPEVKPYYDAVKTFVEEHESEPEDEDIILHSGCNLTTKVHIPGCSCIYSRR